MPQVSTTLAKLVSKFDAGVIDTGAKVAASVSDTGGNFAAGVGGSSGKIDTCGKLIPVVHLDSRIFEEI